MSQLIGEWLIDKATTKLASVLEVWLLEELATMIAPLLKFPFRKWVNQDRADP